MRPLPSLIHEPRGLTRRSPYKYLSAFRVFRVFKLHIFKKFETLNRFVFFLKPELRPPELNPKTPRVLECSKGLVFGMVSEPWYLQLHKPLFTAIYSSTSSTSQLQRETNRSTSNKDNAVNKPWHAPVFVYFAISCSVASCGLLRRGTSGLFSRLLAMSAP